MGRETADFESLFDVIETILQKIQIAWSKRMLPVLVYADLDVFLHTEQFIIELLHLLFI